MYEDQESTARIKEARRFILKSNLQILDIKHLADLEAGYKGKSRSAIRAFKIWKQSHQGQSDVIEIAYGAIEGAMLRMQAQHAVRLYWIIRGDLRDCLKRYITGCAHYPNDQSKTA